LANCRGCILCAMLSTFRSETFIEDARARDRQWRLIDTSRADSLGVSVQRNPAGAESLIVESVRRGDEPYLRGWVTLWVGDDTYFGPDFVDQPIEFWESLVDCIAQFAREGTFSGAVEMSGATISLGRVRSTESLYFTCAGQTSVVSTIAFLKEFCNDANASLEFFGRFTRRSFAESHALITSIREVIDRGGFLQS